MKKILLFLFLIFFVFTIFVIIEVFFEKKTSVVYPKDGLILRESASQKSKKLALIPQGTIIEYRDYLFNDKMIIINGIQGKWVKISYNNESGYIFNGYLVNFNNYDANTVAEMVSDAYSRRYDSNNVPEDYTFPVDSILIKDDIGIVLIRSDNEIESMLYDTGKPFIYLIKNKKAIFISDFNNESMFTGVSSTKIIELNNDSLVDVILQGSSGSGDHLAILLRNKNDPSKFELPLILSDSNLNINNLGKCENFSVTLYSNEDKENLKNYFLNCNTNNFEMQDKE
jgi:hypothetical protein